MYFEYPYISRFGINKGNWSNQIAKFFSDSLFVIY